MLGVGQWRKDVCMRIDEIGIHRVRLRLKAPFRVSTFAISENEAVFVRLVSGSELGWGEGTAMKLPFYSPESAATAFIVARDFIAPSLIGQDICSGEELQERMYAIRGNCFAKAAFDHAWWDLFSRCQRVPLWQAIGGMNQQVSVGECFGVLDSIEELLSRIRNALAQGYPRIKLKFGPGWDLSVVAAVREEFPDVVLHVDCNSAYSLADTEMFKALDQYDLAMIEQPLGHDDIIDHATLQSALSTPICLDESITSAEKARKAIQVGACRFVNIKPGRVSGITTSLRIHEMCEQAGIGTWIGGMLESGLGRTVCVALATLPGIDYPADIPSTGTFYEQDVTDAEVCVRQGGIVSVPIAVGSGALPDEDRLARATVEKAVVCS
jgi:O-succinylbenzoate synthase